MKKPKKQYSQPKNLFDKTRISEDKGLTKKYGLKNKREIWKAEARINRIRTEAKKIITEPEKQEVFFKTLEKKGLIKSSEASIDNVLSLTKENLLDRRLQTFVLKLGLSKTIKEARQLITHRKIKINDRIVTIPSYHVRANEEKIITLIKSNKSKKEKMSITQEMSQEKELNVEENLGEEKND